MTCGICSLVSEQRQIVYEDDKVFVFIPAKIAVLGHLIVAPKGHFPILEQIPDSVVAHLFAIAAKFSSLVYGLFQAEGVNLFVQNGTPAGQAVAHAVVHVIPRKQNDKLSFDWTPKEISEDEMSTLEIQIKEKAEQIVLDKEKPVPVEMPKPIEFREREGEINYLIKQLERVP